MLYKDVLATLAFAATAVAAPTPAPQEDIVGGVTSPAGNFPFIVSLSRTSGSHFCGGTLVNANTVVTAAHCAEGLSASGVKVRAGSLNRNSGGTVVSVSSVMVNPNYVSSAYDGDVAILKLATSIPTSSTVAYATLPASGSDPAGGSSSTVAGWGTTTSGGQTLPAALREVTVPIVSRATCRSNYGSSAITTNMICAGLAAGGKDSCQGDSGGPLVATGTRTLIGIVSWGNGCAAPDAPGVYTRVGSPAVLSYIQANL